MISLCDAGRSSHLKEVVDAKGGVVRHLAAGVLGGENPPPAPLKKGLSQSVEWNGKDDFGRKASGGPFKLRVRAGQGVKFGRFIGEDPCNFGSQAARSNATSTGSDLDIGHFYTIPMAIAARQVSRRDPDIVCWVRPGAERLRWLTPLLFFAAAGFVWHYNATHGSTKLLFPFLQVFVSGTPERLGTLSWLLFAGIGVLFTLLALRESLRGRGRQRRDEADE